MQKWKTIVCLTLLACLLSICLFGCNTHVEEPSSSGLSVESTSTSTSSGISSTAGTTDGTAAESSMLTTEGIEQTTTRVTTIRQDITTATQPNGEETSTTRTRASTTLETGTTTAAPVSWNGPDGYRIVIPDNADEHIRKAAERLQDFFKEKNGENLEIVTDDQQELSKEILVGKTNRSDSNMDIAYNAYAATVKDQKLVFDGGHYLSVDKAVHQFILSNKTSNGIFEVGGEFDLELTKFGKYEYVWGDEFDTDGLDPTKWELGVNMDGYPDAILSDDPDIVRVENSMLRLATRRYYDPTNSLIQYATTYSVRTKHAMSYQYGYLEMRARVPFKQGAWPSFWLVSGGALGARPDPYYDVEVDVFEVFSSTSTLIPNIHKWYKKGKYANSSVKNTQYETAVTDPEKKNRSYTFDSTDGLNDEFHIYGFEWTDKEMSMYVDGEKYMTYDLSFNFDGNTEEGADMSMFHDPLYIIFNNHLFTEQAWWKPEGSVVDNTGLPFEYDIDWIRLYQEPGVGALHLAQQ